jgi:hypothetical protein
MSYQFSVLTKEHQQELLDMFETAGTGTGSFRISRGGDFFAFPESIGMPVYYGISVKGKVLAVIGITEQWRHIAGKNEKVFYIHDLRMHPSLGNPMAYYKLVRGVWDIYQAREDCKWMYSIILESNTHGNTLTRRSSLFPGAKQIGQIHHAGFPLFAGSGKTSGKVSELDPGKAWAFFSEHGKKDDFSLSDERIFRQDNGVFLGITKNNETVAACKIIDQSQARTIVSMQELSLPQKLINLYCRIKRRKTFPGKGQVFTHCYLSYYTTSETGTDHRRDFIAYARKNNSAKHSYIFTGLNSDEAAVYSKGPLDIHFRSGVYAYGEAPEMEFRFPELTLI